MKANRQRSFNWTTWGIILIFSPIVCYLLLIYLKDFIRITPVAGFLAPLLLYQSSVVCLVIGALRSNPIRRYGCLRAAGFVLIDIAVSPVESTGDVGLSDPAFGHRSCPACGDPPVLCVFHSTGAEINRIARRTLVRCALFLENLHALC